VFAVAVAASVWLDYPDFSGKVNPFMLALLLGTGLPILDDVLSVFSKRFDHHSLFHSFFGAALAYAFFHVVFSPNVAYFVLAGQLIHMGYNFLTFDASLFFPLTKRNYGIYSLFGISRVRIKMVVIPLALLFFFFSVFSALLAA